MLTQATHPLRCTNCEVCFAQNLQFTAMINHLVLANEYFSQHCLYDWGFFEMEYFMNIAT